MFLWMVVMLLWIIMQLRFNSLLLIIFYALKLLYGFVVLLVVVKLILLNSFVLINIKVLHLNLIVISLDGVLVILISNVFLLMNLDVTVYLGLSYLELLINIILHLSKKVLLLHIHGDLKLLYLHVLVLLVSVSHLKIIKVNCKIGMV